MWVPPPAAGCSGTSNTAPSSSMHNPRLDIRSQSISSANLGGGTLHGLVGPDGHTGPFPVTASHRRNVRRGSMLELSG